MKATYCTHVLKEFNKVERGLERRELTCIECYVSGAWYYLPLLISSTKVRLVKAMVFSVVMYGCESWTVKRLSAEELMLLNCGVGEDS